MSQMVFYEVAGVLIENNNNEYLNKSMSLM
jgi:hypothetical protein